MSTPNQATVNAEAAAAKLAIKTAANNQWISEADIVIAEMVSQGKFKVTLPILRPVSKKDISTYYQALGYGVAYDNCSSWNGAEWPGLFSFPFGQPFEDPFFDFFFHVCNCKDGCNIIISWKNGF